MLFWSLKPSDCASWVQAWGSIGAIFVAIVIGLHATSVARITAEQLQWRTEFIRLTNAAAIIQIAAGELVGFRDAWAAGPRMTYRRRHMHLLDQCAHLLRSIQPMELPDERITVQLLHALNGTTSLKLLCDSILAATDEDYSDTTKARVQDELEQNAVLNIDHILGYLKRSAEAATDVKNKLKKDRRRHGAAAHDVDSSSVGQ